MSFVDDLRAARVLAVLRRPDIGDVVLDLFDELHGAGVRVVEVTLDQPGALDALRRLVAHAPADVLVGAGTVRSLAQLEAVIDVGGRFAVCPHLDVGLVEAAGGRGLPILPGVMTPSEVAAAVAAGAPALKLFPAGPLTPAYLEALRGPFADVAFVPTGGIAVDEVRRWLDAGAVCVGMGSALVGPDGVEQRVREVLR